MKTDQKIVYDIIKNIDDMFLRNHFQDVDAILESIDIPSTSTNELVAYATATFPAKHKLMSRKEFFSRVYIELRSRPDWDPTHLSGLK